MSNIAELKKGRMAGIGCFGFTLFTLLCGIGFKMIDPTGEITKVIDIPYVICPSMLLPLIGVYIHFLSQELREAQNSQIDQ